MKNCLLGFVLQGDDGKHRVYNPSRHTWNILSESQLNDIDFGDFPFFRLCTNEWNERDIVEVEGQYYFIKGRKFHDMLTGKELRHRPKGDSIRLIGMSKVYYSTSELRFGSAHPLSIELLKQIQNIPDRKNFDEMVKAIYTITQQKLDFVKVVNWEWSEFVRRMFNYRKWAGQA